MSTDSSHFGRRHASLYDDLTLPSNRHIRLLRILPRPDVQLPIPFWMDTEVIRCSINTLSLDEKPEFDALSYTWGNPIAVYEDEEQAKEATETFEKTFEIICNGIPVKVTANLHDALLALRRAAQGGIFQQIAQKQHAEYLWVDSICINQNDVAERAAQVAIMGQIYRQAQTVVIWLGRDDVFTRPATTVLSEIYTLPDDVIGSMKQSIEGLDTINYNTLGLRKIEAREWLSVYAFLNRNWFRRTWILQEFALASHPIVMCGSLTMLWVLLMRSCEILEKSKWYRRIADLAASSMEGYVLKEFASLPGPLIPSGEEQKVCMYHADIDMRFDPARVVLAITNVRAGLGIKDDHDGVNWTPHRQPLNLTELMENFRFSLCTEPSDKVYALCGLLPMDDPRYQQNPQKIVPDYRNPVEQVYTEAALFQLEWSKNLDFLAQVQDPTETRIKTLPSWVPDYSVRLYSNPISRVTVRIAASGPSHSPFSAGADINWRTPVLSQRTLTLSLQGVIYDSIVAVGEVTENPDLLDIIDLLSELPHVYWAEVLDYYGETSAGNGNEDGSLKIEAGFLKGFFKGRGSSRGKLSCTGLQRSHI